MKLKNQKKAGFTLVELMVVAIIVAILAAVAIPLMSGNRRRAAATEGQAGVSTIYTAERVYKAQNGTYINADPVDSLPGIDNNDLNGTYFDHTDYNVTAAGADVMLITANTAKSGTDAKVTGISGTVTLQVNAGGATVWGGTLQ